MFIGGVNFSLHFLAWRHKTLTGFFRDPEFRAYCSVLALAVAVYFAVLWLSRPDGDAGESFRLSLFHAVSMQTTSGFFTDDFTHWPGALPVIDPDRNQRAPDGAAAAGRAAHRAAHRAEVRSAPAAVATRISAFVAPRR